MVLSAKPSVCIVIVVCRGVCAQTVCRCSAMPWQRVSVHLPSVCPDVFSVTAAPAVDGIQRVAACVKWQPVV